MEYLFEALGGFHAEADVHAAVKFCVAMAVSERMFAHLAQILTVGSGTTGFGSDPGWFLERRDLADPEHANWPGWADFRASVDPEGFPLAHPEGFYRREELCRYVLLAIRASLRTRRADEDDVAPVLAAATGPGGSMPAR